MFGHIYLQSLAFDLNYLQFSLLCILRFRRAKHTNKVTCQKHFIILIIALPFCLFPKFQAQPVTQVPGPRSLVTYLFGEFFVFGRLSLTVCLAAYVFSGMLFSMWVPVTGRYCVTAGSATSKIKMLLAVHVLSH